MLTLLFAQQELREYNRDPAYTRYVQNYCSNNPLVQLVQETSIPLLDEIPESFFLPEFGLAQIPQDQGRCGSCYVFSSRAVLHSLLMRDFPYYAELGQAIDFEPLLSGSDSISVQYLLNYSSLTNYYCAGGNFVDVASHVVSTRMKTLELTSHFPYVSFLDSNSLDGVVSTLESPKIPPTRHVLPVYWFEKDEHSGCPVSVFRIRANDRIRGWDERQREQIKHVLTRGFAIETEVNTEGGVSGSASSFQRYTGGILRGECNGGNANHEVAIVGYGTYKGTPVWAIANSWGNAFGISGFYFIAQGSNAYCHEVQAHVMFSRFWNYENDTAFMRSAVYIRNASIYRNYVRRRIRRGYNGLDREDGSYIVTLKWQIAVLLTLMAIPSAFLLYLCIVELFCQRQLQKINKPPVNVRITEQEADAIDWANDCVIGIMDVKLSEADGQLPEISLATAEPEAAKQNSFLLDDQ